MLKIEIKGIRRVQAFIIAKNVQANKLKDSGLKQAGELIRNEVKASIRGDRAEPRSVKTGEFLRSVEIVQSEDSVVVLSDVEHSKFLEFGTSRIQARRHFANTQHRNKKKIEDIINLNIKKI